MVGGLRWQAALAYIDDLLGCSTTWNGLPLLRPKHLRTVLKAASDAGIIFSLDKCHFGHSTVRLLGHGLSRYGLHTLMKKVQTISFFASPRTMGQLHRLLGMFGYYRAFIHQFARIAKPLNDLKSFREPSTGRTDRKPSYNSKATIPWSRECQLAFDEFGADSGGAEGEAGGTTSGPYP